MRTQQLSNGPPGDDNYFNLEDEETRGAANGGCYHNAPAWDPEKMELRRMVDRLLEERRYLPPRQVEQPVPHKVKLPPFLEKDVAAWFKLAEAVLEDNRMRDPRVK